MGLNAPIDRGRRGVRDWILQRASALALGAYAAFLSVFLALHPELDYPTWRGLFDSLWMRFFSALALLSFVVHAWIGSWIVATDYLTERMLGAWGTPLRLAGLSLLALALLAALGFGLQALWR